jgi:hypothetical protein
VISYIKKLEILDKVLSFAESKQYLDFHPIDLSLKNVEKAEAKNVTTLLGLTEEELIKRVENELDCLNKSKEFILSSIENKLTKQCEDIAKFYYTEGNLFREMISVKKHIKTLKIFV